jgi:hypothetical protein
LQKSRQRRERLPKNKSNSPLLKPALLLLILNVFA